MTTSVYAINKGVNRPVEFRGLKGQYIWWLAGGVLSLLLAFVVLYVVGVNPFLCIGVIAVAGTVLFIRVYRLSRVYGIDGLMKRAAARRLPERVRSGTRMIFIHRGADPGNVTSDGAEFKRAAAGVRRGAGHDPVAAR
jgi:uncharacterized membrane protein